jgi:hypothetical protein
VFDIGNGIDVNATLLGHHIPLRFKHMMHKRDGIRSFTNG